MVLYGVAAAQALMAIVLFATIGTTRDAARIAYGSTGLDEQFGTVITVTMIIIAVIFLIIAAGLVVLSIFNGLGKNASRIVTWVFAGIGLCCNTLSLFDSVPGAVAAWEVVHRQFCTKPFASVLDSAIGYAEEGFPVPPGIARSFASNAAKLAKFPSTAAVLLRSGTPPKEGETLANPDLARSLRAVASGGAEEFYRGALARSLVRGLRAGGGLFTEADFAGHQLDVYDPISTTYRGHTIYQTHPPSQGFILLEMLNLVEGFELAELGQNSAAAIHLMADHLSRTNERVAKALVPAMSHPIRLRRLISKR